MPKYEAATEKHREILKRARLVLCEITDDTLPYTEFHRDVTEIISEIEELLGA